jgi:hypothetical protein
MPWSGDATKVSIGPGKLWVGPLTATDPTNASTAVVETAGNFVPIGYTEEGSTFSYAVTSESIEVAEELEAIASRRTSAVATLSFAMAETTARNLTLALNGGLVTTAITSVGPIAASAEVRVKVVLDTDDGARWLFRRCYSVGSVEIQNRKAPAKRVIAVEYRLEKPASGDAFTAFPNAAGLV